MSFDVIKTWDEKLVIKISVALEFVAAVRREEKRSRSFISGFIPQRIKVKRI